MPIKDSAAFIAPRMEFPARMVALALFRLQKAQDKQDQKAIDDAANFAVNQIIYFSLVLMASLKEWYILNDTMSDEDKTRCIKEHADAILNDKQLDKLGLSADVIQVMQAVVEYAKDVLPEETKATVLAKHPDMDITTTCRLLEICGQSAVDKVKKSDGPVVVDDKAKESAKNILQSALTSDSCIYARWRAESKKGFFSPRSKQTLDIDRAVRAYLEIKVRTKEAVEQGESAALQKQLEAVQEAIRVAEAYLDKKTGKKSENTRAPAVLNLKSLLLKEQGQLLRKIEQSKISNVDVTLETGFIPPPKVLPRYAIEARMEKVPGWIVCCLADDKTSPAQKSEHLQKLRESLEECRSGIDGAELEKLDRWLNIIKTADLMPQFLADDTKSPLDKIQYLEGFELLLKECRSELKDTSKLDEILKAITEELDELVKEDAEWLEKASKDLMVIEEAARNDSRMGEGRLVPPVSS